MQYPLYKLIRDYCNAAGKDFFIIEADLDITTLSTGGGLVGIAEMANDPADFTTGQQIYFRSDSAADTEKSCKVLGQKVGGEFGWTTFTTDDTDGTTPVDEGLWNFIMYTEKVSVAAGNLIIDDDGASGTVYFTLPLGVAPKLGVVYVPTGYKGTGLVGSAFLTDAPSNVNAVDVYQIGDSFGLSLNTSNPKEDSGLAPYAHLAPENTQIIIKGMYNGAAVTTAKLEVYLIFWEA